MLRSHPLLPVFSLQQYLDVEAVVTSLTQDADNSGIEVRPPCSLPLTSVIAYGS
jgi:hypothetical protein